MARMHRLYPPAVAALALLASGCASPCVPPAASGPGGPVASFGPAGGYTVTKPQEASVASGQSHLTGTASQPSKSLLGLPIDSGGMVCKDGVCEIPPPPVDQGYAYPEGDTSGGTVALLHAIREDAPSPQVAPLPESPACWQFAAAVGTGFLSLAGFAWLVYRKK